jgi:hypothetical protein
MKLKVQISKLKCLRTSVDASPDKVYSAIYFFTGDKIGDDFVPDKTSLQVKATDVEQGVKKGYVWKPQENVIEFDLNGKEYFGLNFCCFEKDNGKLYDELRAGDVNSVRKALDLSGLKFPANPASPEQWVEPLAKLLIALFKFSRQDDRIGSEPFAYKTSDSNVAIAKTFQFKKLFANYEAVLNFSIEK